MTPTTDEIREMALDIEQWSERLLREGSGMGPSHEYIADAAAALRQWIAERERVSVTHEWCGDDPKLPASRKTILEQIAEYDNDHWFSE